MQTSETHEPQAPTRGPRACRSFRSQAAGADLSGSGTANLPPEAARHLEVCGACREEIRRDRIALAALRGAADLLADEAGETGAGTLSPARRRLVLERAAQRPGLGWGLLPLLDWRPAAGIAFAAALAVVVGVGAWSLGPAPGTAPAADAVRLASMGPGRELEVVADGPAVKLSWRSDGRSEHRVIRATDPRRLASGRVEMVRGTEWVDPEMNGARVVFYVVD